MTAFNELSLDGKMNLARRDDVLSMLVPSDIRQMIGDISRCHEMLERAAETFDELDKHTHPNIECDAIAHDCRSLLPVRRKTP